MGFREAVHRALDDRRRRTAFHIGWAALVVSGPVLEVITPATTEPEDWAWPVGLMSFAPAAALILIRRPGNRVGRVLAAVGSAAGVIFIGGWVAVTWPDRVVTLFLEPLVGVTVLVTFWGLLALLYIFPTGEPLPGWSRWAYRILTLSLLGIVPLLMVANPGPMAMTGRDNPLGVEAGWIASLVETGLIFLPIGAAVGVAALVARFRRSAGIERAQLKVFLVGSALVLGLVGLISFVPEELDEVGVVDAIFGVLVILGFWALPGSIVMAILRYRLYEIDRLASRTVTYVLVIALLGAGYTGMVVALQTVLPFEGALPVAASTLAMAWVSIPLVRFVQRVVDRRFFRSRYDAQEVVAGFSAVVRSNVDLAELTDRLTETVTTTFEPGHVSVWIPESPS